MKVLKTAVIGLGRIGWKYHIPEIIKHDEFELTAVVDPLDERCQGAHDELHVRNYHTMDAMFADASPDVVVIASPTPFHKDQAIQAMKQGCDVFCDKPLAIDVSEGAEIQAAAKRLNKKLMVYQPHRATDETVSLQNVLSRNLIGPVYMLKLAVSEYTRRNDWQALKKHGGGMLANYGSHYIDQLLYLTGFSPIEEISCHLKTIASLGDADDVVKAVFCLQDGTILDLDINMACSHKLGKWHIFGKYGTIIDDDDSWIVRYYDPDKMTDLDIQKGLAAGDRKYRADETIPWQEKTVKCSDFEPVDYYAKVYEYFAEDADPFVPLAQTITVMNTIQKCRD